MHTIFDLDGTLSHSYPGIENAFRHALSKLNHHAAQRPDFRDCVGSPLPHTFAAVLDIPETDCPRAIDYFREYYAAKGWQENELYPGIKPLLTELHERKISLSVVTNKPTVFAEKILEHFEIRNVFHHVLGQNLGHSAVSKSALLGNVLGRDRGQRAVYVGDTKHDIEASRTCGIPSITVGYGYGDHQEIHLARPEYFVHSVDALKQCLDEVIAQ